MAITVTIPQVFLFMFINVIVFSIIQIKVRSHFEEKNILLIAQLNSLRLWLSNYIEYLPQEKARDELINIYLKNEEYRIVKEWYKTFYSNNS